MQVDSIKEGIQEMAQSLARLKVKADESFEQQEAKRQCVGRESPAPGPATLPSPGTAAMVPFAQAGKGS